MEAAQGGLAEVELGQLASTKASSEKVKSFAQRMVTDHGKANDELKSLASSKQIMLPTMVAGKEKAEHDKFAKLSGDAFDRAYVRDMVADHKKDVAAFRQEASNGKDPDVKAWASKTLPTLEEHLKMIEDIQKEMGASSAKPTGTSGTSTPHPGGTSTPGTSGRPGTSTAPGTSSTPGTPGNPNPGDVR